MPFYESDKPSRWAFGIGGWIIVILLFSMALSAAAWGISVLVSDIKGQGDAIKKKNDAVNRIAASERFEERYQDILAADRRIDVMHNALSADPKSGVAQTNYAGAVNYCLEVVAEYNADARKYTAEQFRASDLPAQIDNLDSATDCKESQ